MAASSYTEGGWAIGGAIGWVWGGVKSGTLSSTRGGNSTPADCSLVNIVSDLITKGKHVYYWNQWDEEFISSQPKCILPKSIYSSVRIIRQQENKYKEFKAGGFFFLSFSLFITNSKLINE